MPIALTQAQFQAVAKELLASSATMLSAERRSYASIELDYSEAQTDVYKNLAGVADALDALATDLRSA